MKGLIIKKIADLFTVYYNGKEVDASARGNLKKNNSLILVGDFVDFNGHHAIVTALKDVMEWNMICDVSFEEVDNGSISGV